jgi:hypothetical protein
VGYGLVTKTFMVECTFQVVVDKTKCQIMNVVPWGTKLRWIISPNFFGAKSFEATIFYNDFQHNIPTLQCKANKLYDYGGDNTLLIP